MKNRLRSGKQRTMSRRDHYTPPKRRHGREPDATQLASSGSIPTNAAPKPHVTAHVWSVQRCAIIFRTDLLSNKALRVVLCVACQEDIFRIEDSFLISIADVSRAHFYADAVRDVRVPLPDEDPESIEPSIRRKLRKTMYGSLDTVRICPRRGFFRATSSIMTWKPHSICFFLPFFPSFSHGLCAPFATDHSADVFPSHSATVHTCRCPCPGFHD